MNYRNQIKGNILPLILVAVVAIGIGAAVILSNRVSFKNSGAANGYAVLISYPLDKDKDGAEPICEITDQVKITVQIVAPAGVTAMLQREYYVAGDSSNPDRYLPLIPVKNGDVKTFTYPWPGGKVGTETHAGFNLLNATTGNAYLDQGTGFDFFIPNCPSPTPTATPAISPTPLETPVPTPTPAGYCVNYLEIKVGTLGTPRVEPTPGQPR